MPIIKRGKPSIVSAKCTVVAMGHRNVLATHLATAKNAGKKEAKMHGEILRRSDGSVDLAAEINKHPDALWLRVKAIEADRENDNGDYFSEEEILKSYRTFEGCPVFTNHENTKVENAKGKVVLAEWDDNDKSVYCTLFIDRDANPALCRAVEEGYVTDVSMGTQVDYSICSICNQKAYTANDYCPHVKTMKGRHAEGKKVYEENYGLKFIEISVVTDGACKDCTIREVLDPEEFSARAHQSLVAAANTIKTVKKSNGLYKDGGQAEIEMLNAAMDNIEQVLRSMLDQRQYIDLEFMNDLTEVFAELQHVSDELVDQGYGSLGQGPAPTPQDTGAPPMPEPTEEGAAIAPLTSGPTSTGIGSITRPASSVSETKTSSPATLIQNRVKDLQERITKIQQGNNDNTAVAGGKDVSKQDNRQKTIEKLANIWENPSVKQFTTEVAEGDFKIIVGKEEVLGLRGGKKIASLKVAELDEDIQQALKEEPQRVAAIMLDAFKERQASFLKKAEVNAEDQWAQTMESQLRDQKPELHPRQNDPRDSVTEVQLGKDYKGYDWHKQGLEQPRESITEKQLHGIGTKKDFPGHDYHKVQDEPRDETMEPQLRNEKWKGNSTPATSEREWAAGVSEQKQEITERQLNNWKDADDRLLPENKITEKQLMDQKAPLGRRVASVTKENAKTVLTAAKKAIGLAAVAAEASADDVIAASNEFQSNPRNGMAAIMAIETFARNHNKLSKEAGLKDHILSNLSIEFEPDIALTALKIVASNPSLLEEAIAEASKKPEIQPSTEEILKAAAVENNEDEDEDKDEEVEGEVEVGEDGKKQAKASAEEVKVIMTIDDVQVNPENKEAFVKAAFKHATKLASDQGVTITKHVHVKREGNDVEVAMFGVKKASKKEDVKCTCESSSNKKQTVASGNKNLKARSENRKSIVESQFGGGGGGMNAPGMGAGGPASGGTTLPAQPAGGMQMPDPQDVGAFSEEQTADSVDDNIESMPPGSICPSCGSDDVDVKGGNFGCNNCGAEGQIEVNVKVTNWPDTIKEQGPGEGAGEGDEIDEGIGEMEGGPGMEIPDAGIPDAGIPNIGVAAVFNVTPEMVKISEQKPIGSFCPHCGSSKVRLAEDTHSGQCRTCDGRYRIDTYWGPSDNCLIARVAWFDNNVRKLAIANIKKITQAKRTAIKNASNLNQKRDILATALKAKGWTKRFSAAGLKDKAIMIGELAEQGLIRKD